MHLAQKWRCYLADCPLTIVTMKLTLLLCTQQSCVGYIGFTVSVCLSIPYVVFALWLVACFMDYAYMWHKYNPWASYQIRKIAGCACAGNAGNVFPRRRFQRKPIVSDPGMHHGTCVTHVPWCMPGSLTCGDGENVPGIPGACAPAILRIWQEAHERMIITYHFHVNSSRSHR